MVKINLLISGNLPDDVLKRLEVLFATPKGTVAFDREFGLSVDLVDLPINLARIRLMEEAHNLLLKYEPGYRVKDVQLKIIDEKHGEQCFQVVVTNG